MVRFRWALAVLIALGVLAAGCGRIEKEAVPEAQNKSYLRAKRYLREDRRNEALDAFLVVISQTPSNAPESHLEVGRLYQNHLNDPIAAIYHYRRFLEQKQGSQEAPIVRQMIDSAKKDFATQLPGSPFDSDADRLDLLKMLQEARTQNETLKQELAQTKEKLASANAIASSANAARAAQTASTATPSSQSPRPSTSVSAAQAGIPQSTATNAAAGPRRYTVEQGDTLSRVSTRMYGTPARWEDIFRANREILATPHSLRVGQSLVIPQ